MLGEFIRINQIINMHLYYLAILIVPILYLCSYQVTEGNIGIIYRFGQLQQTYYKSGLHLKSPYPIEKSSQIDIRPQTDTVDKVFCGTKDGLGLIFESIEVGNTLYETYALSTIMMYGENYDKYLVKDKVSHQTNVICSSLTAQEIYIDKFDTLDDLLLEFLKKENVQSGLDINFVRLKKPTLPHEIKIKYEKIAEEKVALQVAVETQARKMKETDTERLIADIRNKISIQQKESDEEIAKINDRMLKSHEQTISDAKLYTLKNEALGMTDLLRISGYLQLKQSEHMSNNSKYFFGETPSMIFVDSIEHN
jgi:regulator of protease activity HflC (stomatin/prohibitin superfamily)